MDQSSITYGKDYRLSVLFSRDSCRYMVTEGEEIFLSDIISFSDPFKDIYSEQLREIFSPWIKSGVEVNVAVLDNRLTLIDSAYVSEENKRSILSAVTTIYPTDQIFDNELFNSGTSQIFVVSAQVDKIIKETFPEIIPVHVTYTLDTFYKRNILMPGFTLFACFSETSFLLHLYDEGRLILTSQYNYKSDNDILYYVARLFSLLVKDNDLFYIHLSGLAEGELDRIVEVLSQYYKNVARISDSLTHSSYSDNRSIDLFSIAVCE